MRIDDNSMSHSKPLQNFDENSVLRTIFEGTAKVTGESFFRALVKKMCEALQTHGAWVTEYFPEKKRLRALSFLMDGQWMDGYEFDIANTPCEAVVEQARLIHFPDRLIDLYPLDDDIREAGIVSYLGIPLLDDDDRVLGHIAVVDRRPIPEEPKILNIFQIFAARAASEMRRMRRESQVREREQKLVRLIDGAMDAIIELDDSLNITQVNSAAEKVLRGSSCELASTPICRMLDDSSAGRIRQMKAEFDQLPQGRQSQWIAGGLIVKPDDQSRFPAEATLSRFEVERRPFYTVVLRNVNDRFEAEQQIQSLTDEKEYLKEELKELGHFDEIIGQSQSLQAVLREVGQVAPTDASVLLLGETGTGKELFARAIHSSSNRSDQSFIKVNCAAIPASLIESEFFGHEKGAFTGATSRREGRFALADKGTIFLDEVGELPLELQGKLLRVLQEGDFEPVGSSQTRTVDVRVLAATNRDLQQAATDGEFREDLYYRLNVFPIHLPPLRERGDDVVTMADAFAKRFAKKMGRCYSRLSDEDARRLRAYDWPGNVRELENIVERASITSINGRLNFDRAIPKPADAAFEPTIDSTENAQGRVRTVEEFMRLERDNIFLALESANWKVAGDQGAANLLGMKPSTLNSRMKSLGIRRPSLT